MRDPKSPALFQIGTRVGVDVRESQIGALKHAPTRRSRRIITMKTPGSWVKGLMFAGFAMVVFTLLLLANSPGIAKRAHQSDVRMSPAVASEALDLARTKQDAMWIEA